MNRRHNSNQMKRKMTTSFGNQLVFIKKKSLRRNVKPVKKPVENLLIDLKNASKDIIEDLSDCEFIEKKTYQMMSPNPRKSLQKDYEKESHKQSTTDRVDGNTGTMSTKKFNEPSSSIFKKSVSSKFQSGYKSKKSSAIKDAEVIDLEAPKRKLSSKIAESNYENLESDEENFVSFDDW